MNARRKKEDQPEIPIVLIGHITPERSIAFGRSVSDIVWRVASALTDEDRARARAIREQHRKEVHT